MNRAQGHLTITVPCEDNYEAQKLASLILVKDDKTGDTQTFIKSVINCIGNEVIISLMDGSSHSILLQDNDTVERFADFIQSVTEQNDHLTAAYVHKDTVTIAKNSMGNVV